MPVTLTEIQSLGPLQRQYKWDVEFLWDPYGAVPTSTDTGAKTIPPETLAQLLSQVNARCLSSQVPTPKFSLVEADPHGIKIVEPGIVDLSGDIQLTLVETTDLKARKLIWYLQQYAMADESKSQFNIHSAGSDKSNELTVKLKRLDNQGKINLTYLCYKCFINNVTDPDFQSTNGNVQCAFQLHYNYFRVGFGDVTTTVANAANAVTYV